MDASGVAFQLKSPGHLSEVSVLAETHLPHLHIRGKAAGRHKPGGRTSRDKGSVSPSAVGPALRSSPLASWARQGPGSPPAGRGVRRTGLCEGKAIQTPTFRLDIRKNVFPERVVRPQTRLPREVMESPSLEGFKNRVDVALQDMI